MAMKVMYNAGAQLSLGQLNKNISKAGKALAKVSSGQKIVSAQDDSASFSISEKMRGQIRALLQDNQNVQNGSSMLRTAERGIDQIIQNIRTLKEKAIDAANDSNTDEDRATIQKEFNQLVSTIDDIAIGTEFNGKRLLDGTYSGGQKISDDSGGVSSSGNPKPRNVPPLPDGYPFFKTVSSPTQSYSAQITGADNSTITKGGIYTIDSDFTGAINVNTTEAVKFVSSNSAQTLNNVQITGPSGGDANIWIENLSIENNAGMSIFKFQGSNNVLNVAGENNFKFLGASYAAVINVGDGLNVQSTSNGSITLKNPSGSGGAGIGSNASESSNANIVISGVNITANVYRGAAIGSGQSGSIGNITIENSTMDLHGNYNANIGSGHSHASAGNIMIVNADITSENVDTGVGSGFSYSTCGNIGIYNSILNISNTYSACIGSGEASSCGDIFVSNSDITGKSSVGACIGTGSSSATAGDITVINETKVKHNCPKAAAIGSGKNGIVTGKINYSNSIKVDWTNCYVDTLDLEHPGIGRGKGGKVQGIGEDNFKPVSDSTEYPPETKTVNQKEAL